MMSTQLQVIMIIIIIIIIKTSNFAALSTTVVALAFIHNCSFLSEGSTNVPAVFSRGLLAFCRIRYIYILASTINHTLSVC